MNFKQGNWKCLKIPLKSFINLSNWRFKAICIYNNSHALRTLEETMMHSMLNRKKAAKLTGVKGRQSYFCLTRCAREFSMRSFSNLLSGTSDIKSDHKSCAHKQTSISSFRHDRLTLIENRLVEVEVKHFLKVDATRSHACDDNIFLRLISFSVSINHLQAQTPNTETVRN